MAKKQYNARLEPIAIEQLQAIAARTGASVAEVIEASIYWLAGDDRALADCPLALREAITARCQATSAPAIQPATALASDDLQGAIQSAILPVLQRIEALEKPDGLIAA